MMTCRREVSFRAHVPDVLLAAAVMADDAWPHALSSLPLVSASASAAVVGAAAAISCFHCR